MTHLKPVTATRTTRFPPAFGALLFSAALAGLGAVSVACPAAAHVAQTSGSHLSASAQHLAGVWSGERFRASVYERNGQFHAYVRVRPPCGDNCALEPVLEGILSPSADGWFQEGEWVERTARPGAVASGRWRLSTQGDRLRVDFIGTDPHRLNGVLLDRAPPPDNPSPTIFQKFIGTWNVVWGGTMTFREDYKRLVAEYRSLDEFGVARPSRFFIFHPENVTTASEAGDTLVGDWQAIGPREYEGGRVELTMIDGGRRFAGPIEDPAHPQWSGVRASAAQEPDRPRSDPAPLPEPRPDPRPIPNRPSSERPTPPDGGGFQPLGAWAVRVDRVENPRDDRLVHVYLTLRNDSSRNLLQTQGVSVIHEDSSGIAVESGQGLKALPGAPELFGSPPPIVMPGRELRTKFVFDRNRGASTVRITVSEGADHSAAFEF